MNILYLSYDGMTDPLGRSQVIPYLQGLSALGYQISLISYEKPAVFDAGKEQISRLLESSGIEWHPLIYTARPPVISTIKDIRKGRRLVKQLHRKKQFRFIHCRSYISALIGLHFKRKYALPFLFDMRGFWADERVDGKIWSLKNPVYKMVYRYFKKKERSYFSESSHIVSLTNAGKQEILKMGIPGLTGEKISVIPCCTDLNHFQPYKKNEVLNSRRRALNIDEKAMVVSYLGSFGTWYMSAEMLRFFSLLRETRPDAIFLLISRDLPDEIFRLAADAGLPPESLRIVPAGREEVPELLAISNYNLFFIQPVFSKKASSPTKMGEALGMGIPVVCNDGIGDCSDILTDTPAGFIVPDFSDEAYKSVINRMLTSNASSPESIRKVAFQYFNLEQGVQTYAEIYQKLAAINSSQHDLS